MASPHLEQLCSQSRLISYLKHARRLVVRIATSAPLHIQATGGPSYSSEGHRGKLQGFLAGKHPPYGQQA